MGGHRELANRKNMVPPSSSLLVQVIQAGSAGKDALPTTRSDVVSAAARRTMLENVCVCVCLWGGPGLFSFSSIFSALA